MAKSIITNSYFSKKELERYLGVTSQKMSVAWLGLEHVYSMSPDQSVLEKHGLKNKPYILAVSSNNPNKNFAAVAIALEMLGDKAPHCVIAGQRNSRVFGESGAQHDRITFLGYVSDAELYALYQYASCLLFPSFYEGFGLPPMEAMALGCPAIVSKASAMPEICGDAALYCDPHDAKTLVDAIHELMSSAAIREKLINHGKARIPLFSWRKACDVVVENIENITKE